MNALKTQTTVIQMLRVPILWAVTHVNVIVVILEMELLVQVGLLLYRTVTRLDLEGC